MAILESQFGINIRTINSNSTTTLFLSNNSNGILILPSTLSNAILNFNFTLNGLPVTTGIAGTLTLTAQYKEGPIVALTTLDLSSANNYKIIGKYTQVNASLTGLTGADKVIIYADQDANIQDSGSGSGTIEQITSNNGSIVVTNPTGPITNIQVAGGFVTPSTATNTINSLNAGNSANVVLTWNNAFVSTAYTITASAYNSQNLIFSVNPVSKTTTTATLQVTNLSTSNASAAITVEAIAQL